MGDIKNLTKQIIHTPSLFKKDEEFNDDRFMRVRVAAMHTGINRNNSRFSKKCIEKAKDTFKNIPVLADVCSFENENGDQVIDYRGHSMHIEEDAFNKNEQRMIYDEKVVGIVPESNNFELVLDEETGEYYAWVDALLYRDYGNYACDVLDSRGGLTDVSMEIGCNDMSYSLSDNCLDVGEMVACGITLLGEDVKPGMYKAHAKTFSISEDSKQKQLFDIIQELKESLDNYIKANANEYSEKGGNDTVDETKIVEEVTESASEVTDENATSEVIAETTEEEVTETIVEDTVEDTPEEVTQGNEEPVVVENSITYAVNDKQFAVSLDEIQFALNTLVNDTYSEQDGCYYATTIYEDHLVMIDYWTGKAYRQSYKKRSGNYSLSGDRVPVKSCWLTQDEEDALDAMRSNYSVIETQLKDYQLKEENAQKDALFVSEDYSSISDKDEFKALAENHAEFSVDELRGKLDSIILDYAKKGNLSFAVEQPAKANFVALPIQKKTTKKNRYGSLFSK